MTSSNGNVFRVTGPLCEEFTGLGWSPRTKASDEELWFFSLICARINGWVNNREAGDLMRYRAHYDVIVMVCGMLLHLTTLFHFEGLDKLMLYITSQTEGLCACDDLIVLIVSFPNWCKQIP